MLILKFIVNKSNQAFCGDYLSYGSLNAAIKSGKEVSKSVMSNWNEINKQENLFSKAI